MFQIPFKLDNYVLIYKYNNIPKFSSTLDLIMPNLKTSITIRNNYIMYKKQTSVPYLSYDDDLHSQK